MGDEGVFCRHDENVFGGGLLSKAPGEGILFDAPPPVEADRVAALLDAARLHDPRLQQATQGARIVRYPLSR